MLRIFKTIAIAAAASLSCIGVASAQFGPPGQFAPGALEAALNGPRTLNVTCQGSSRSPLGDSVICLGFAEFQLRSDGPGAQVGLRIAAPTAHCADVNYYVERVSVGRVGLSGWLAPGQSTVMPIANDLPAGAHAYRLWAWGRIGGCLVDAMHSFGAVVEPVIIP